MKKLFQFGLLLTAFFALICRAGADTVLSADLMRYTAFRCPSLRLNNSSSA